MELDNYVKINVSGILKKSINDIYYLDFEKVLRKTMFKMEDILIYLILKFEGELNKDKRSNSIKRIIYSIDIIIDNIPNITNKNNIKQIYELINLAKEKDDTKNLEEVIKELEKTLDYRFPQLKNEIKEETSEENLESQKELAQELYLAQKQILELEKNIKALEKKLDKQSKDYQELKQQKINLEEIKTKLETDIKSNNNKLEKAIKLEETLKEYKETIKNLEKTIKETQENHDKVLNDLIKENENLSIENNTYSKKTIQQQEKTTKENLIKELILSDLYENNKIDIDGIIKLLNKNNIETTRQEVYEQLIELRRIIAIEGPLLEELPPIYKIDKKVPTTTRIFPYTIGNTEELNIMLISDEHICGDISLDTLKEQHDMLYDYSTKNNVKMILNLGDVFEGIDFKDKMNLTNLKNIMDMITKFTKSIPENTGIYHGMLGGNHDKILLSYGINPLKILEEQREDLINLGYNNRKIQLGTNTQNQLLLHHPERHFEEDVQIGYDLKNYLNRTCPTQQEKDQIYCHLIGHTHKSKLDIINSYCMVPSYRKDRVENGCWHLKFHFHPIGHIDYITFIPLVVKNNKLISTSEINYQKILKP